MFENLCFINSGQSRLRDVILDRLIGKKKVREKKTVLHPI